MPRDRPYSGSVGAGIACDRPAYGTRQDSLPDVRAHDQQARAPAEDAECVHSSRIAASGRVEIDGPARGQARDRVGGRDEPEDVPAQSSGQSSGASVT